MDCTKIGALILQLRKERGLTQKDIADTLNISPKTVSKWECGMGCPDISLWPGLSDTLGVDIKKMLEGELYPNVKDKGNIRKINFYVCPICGNVLISTGIASISCCGRNLSPLIPQNIPNHHLEIQSMDLDYYITFNHPMEKTHFIMFVAYVSDDKILLNRLYPEQTSEVRFPEMHGHGKIYAYCSNHGLWEQTIERKFKTGRIRQAI